MDQVRRADHAHRVPPGARRPRTRPAAVRHRLVVLSTRLGTGYLHAAIGRARRDRREPGGARENLRRKLRSDLFSRDLVRDRSKMFAQEVAPEVSVEIAPDRVDVVAVVLRVVVLHEKRRALNPVVVLLTPLGLARPG